jgi:protein-tyrosine phosphatase
VHHERNNIDMSTTMDRHIPLEGASNFRDFGGYRTQDGKNVAWRRLFRSDKLSELTAADYAHLAAHGIRRVHDLRRDSETQLAPTAWPGPDAPEIARSPLFLDEAGPSTFQKIALDANARHDAELSRAIMLEMYTRMVTEPGPLAIYRTIFSELAEGTLPVLYHCSGGKDRTGVTCALILLALGVPRDDVVEDFMVSQVLYGADKNFETRISQVVAASPIGHWSKEALAPIFTVEEAYIERALGLVDEAGGVEAFLIQRARIAPETLARVRDMLLAK